MLTARSACGVSVSLSVTLLLARLVSVVRDGAVTVTVLVSEPVALGLIVPVSVILTVWPFTRLIPLHAAGVIAPHRGASEGRVRQSAGDRVSQGEAGDRARPVVGDRDRVCVASARHDGGRAVG